ncbi:MAG TPA: hypothetical protein VH601_10560 [Bryobacteraceae bacterium]
MLNRKYAVAICGVLAAVLLFSTAAIKAPKLIPLLAGLAVLLAYVAARYLKRTGRDQKVKLLLFPLLRRFISSETQRVFGRLDGCVEGELYGWALNAGELSIAPKLTIHMNNRRVADVLPVQYRPDVGKHCFYFDLSGTGPPDQLVRVDAQFAGGRPLPNSPLRVEIPARSTARPLETVLFMHIAKTAGTAFREAIAENYRQSEIAYLYPDPPGLLTYKLDLLPLEQRRAFRLVIGHFQYGMHDLFPQECQYVTIVREPVARIVSHFRYILEKQEAPGFTDSADSLVELLERRATVNLDNLMTRCFSGVDEKDVLPGSVGQEVYSLALEHLKTRFSCVGHQERAVEAYSTLQQRFNWKPRSTLDNVNRSKLPGKQDYEPARKAIEHFNRWDCQLYAEICRLFP